MGDLEAEAVVAPRRDIGEVQRRGPPAPDTRAGGHQPRERTLAMLSPVAARYGVAGAPPADLSIDEFLAYMPQGMGRP